MSSLVKKSLILMMAISLLPLSAFSAEDINVPQIRGLDIDPVSIEVQDYLLEDQQVESIDELDQSTSLKFGITELVGIVGKSQFIRFDEKVKRISIANPELADLVLLSPQELLLNGKIAGETTLILWGDSNDPVFFDLVINNDSQAFLKAVKKLAPDEDINMEFSSTGVVLSGQISSTNLKTKITSLAKAYGLEIIDLAESPTSQVVLDVKVVEASKGLSKALTATFYNSDGTKSSLKSNGSYFDGSSSGFNFFSYSPGDLDITLKARKNKGKVRILAQPKLLAADGKEASFSAGQEVPVPTGMNDYGNVGYEYKSVGVDVTFKPIILADSKRIILEVSPEVSEIDSSASVTLSDGSVATGFKTRTVKTTVELADGETFIIAGLYKRTDSETNEQVPLLGDIPILGKLFKSSTYLKDDTELMIFVTPRIVEANSKTNIDRI